jgi:hypothetical protein
MEYFYVTKNGLDEMKKINTNLIKIISISDFFENFYFTNYFIKEYVLKNLDESKCFSFIETS